MLLFAKYKLCSSSAREHLRNLSIAVVNSIMVVVSSLNSLMVQMLKYIYPFVKTSYEMAAIIYFLPILKH